MSKLSLPTNRSPLLVPCLIAILIYLPSDQCDPSLLRLSGPSSTILFWLSVKLGLNLKAAFSCPVYSESFHQSHSWQLTLQKTWSQYRTSASSERMFVQGEVYGCHWANSIPLDYFMKVNLKPLETMGRSEVIWILFRCFFCRILCTVIACHRAQ